MSALHATSSGGFICYAARATICFAAYTETPAFDVQPISLPATPALTHTAKVTSVAFMTPHAGTLLVLSGDEAGTVSLWDVSTLLTGKVEVVLLTSVSVGSIVKALCTSQGDAVVADYRGGLTLLHATRRHHDAPCALKSAPQKAPNAMIPTVVKLFRRSAQHTLYAAVGYLSGKLLVFNMEKLQAPIALATYHTEAVQGIAVYEAGGETLFVTSSKDQSVQVSRSALVEGAQPAVLVAQMKLFLPNTLKARRDSDGYAARFIALSAAPEGRLLASAPLSGALICYDLTPLLSSPPAEEAPRVEFKIFTKGSGLPVFALHATAARGVVVFGRERAVEWHRCDEAWSRSGGGRLMCVGGAVNCGASVVGQAAVEGWGVRAALASADRAIVVVLQHSTGTVQMRRLEGLPAKPTSLACVSATSIAVGLANGCLYHTEISHKAATATADALPQEVRYKMAELKSPRKDPLYVVRTSNGIYSGPGVAVFSVGTDGKVYIFVFKTSGERAVFSFSRSQPGKLRNVHYSKAIPSRPDVEQFVEFITPFLQIFENPIYKGQPVNISTKLAAVKRISFGHMAGGDAQRDSAASALVLHHLPEHANQYKGVLPRLLFVGGQSGVVDVYHFVTPVLRSLPQAPQTDPRLVHGRQYHGARLLGLDVAQCGARLMAVVTFAGGTLQVLDATTLLAPREDAALCRANLTADLLVAEARHAGDVPNAKFMPAAEGGTAEASLFATASYDGTAQLWLLSLPSEGKVCLAPLLSVRQHTGRVYDILWVQSNNVQRLYSCGDDSTCKAALSVVTTEEGDVVNPGGESISVTPLVRHLQGLGQEGVVCLQVVPEAVGNGVLTGPPEAPLSVREVKEVKVATGAVPAQPKLDLSAMRAAAVSWWGAGDVASAVTASLPPPSVDVAAQQQRAEAALLRALDTLGVGERPGHGASGSFASLFVNHLAESLRKGKGLQLGVVSQLIGAQSCTEVDHTSLATATQTLLGLALSPHFGTGYWQRAVRASLGEGRAGAPVYAAAALVAAGGTEAAGVMLRAKGLLLEALALEEGPPCLATPHACGEYTNHSDSLHKILNKAVPGWSDTEHHTATWRALLESGIVARTEHSAACDAARALHERDLASGEVASDVTASVNQARDSFARLHFHDGLRAYLGGGPMPALLVAPRFTALSKQHLPLACLVTALPQKGKEARGCAGCTEAALSPHPAVFCRAALCYFWGLMKGDDVSPLAFLTEDCTQSALLRTVQGNMLSTQCWVSTQQTLCALACRRPSDAVLILCKDSTVPLQQRVEAFVRQQSEATLDVLLEADGGWVYLSERSVCVLGSLFLALLLDDGSAETYARQLQASARADDIALRAHEEKSKGEDGNEGTEGAGPTTFALRVSERYAGKSGGGGCEPDGWATAQCVNVAKRQRLSAAEGEGE